MFFSLLANTLKRRIKARKAIFTHIYAKTREVLRYENLTEIMVKTQRSPLRADRTIKKN